MIATYAGHKARLFCLPHAGGGASSFREIVRLAPPWLDVRPVELPGHQRRIGEPPLRSIRTLAEQLADELSTEMDVPFGLLGHSMGALAAFEITRALRRRNGPMPAQLVVVAAPCPRSNFRHAVHELPDGEFVDAIARFGAIPGDVRSNPQLLSIFLPALRADFEAIETYVYEPEPALSVAITLIMARDDAVVRVDQTSGWAGETVAGVTSVELPDDHFLGASQGVIIARAAEAMRGAVDDIVRFGARRS